MDIISEIKVELHQFHLILFTKKLLNLQFKTPAPKASVISSGANKANGRVCLDKTFQINLHVRTNIYIYIYFHNIFTMPATAVFSAF